VKERTAGVTVPYRWEVVEEMPAPRRALAGGAQVRPRRSVRMRSSACAQVVHYPKQKGGAGRYNMLHESGAVVRRRRHGTVRRHVIAVQVAPL